MGRFSLVKAKKKYRCLGLPGRPNIFYRIFADPIFFLNPQASKYDFYTLFNFCPEWLNFLYETSLCQFICVKLHVEVAYYSSDVGRKDTCSHLENTMINMDLKKNYKTVLPICQGCLNNNLTPFTQRLFGKGKKV